MKVKNEVDRKSSLNFILAESVDLEVKRNAEIVGMYFSTVY